ncbi:MAG TPA: GNAT family N-acetyltransferase [Thiobacillaceae bacterium]|nr:GNAT family N-acetyltransferase [Thiobacillaceae bacterium]
MEADITTEVQCLVDFPPLMTAPVAGHFMQAPGFDLDLQWFEHLARTALTPAPRLRLWQAANATERLLLPMHEMPRHGWGMRRLHALANYYTSLFASIGDANMRDRGLRAICAQVARTKPAWDVVDLHPMDPGSEDFALLSDALREAGFRVHRYFCFGNWHLPCAGLSFADYWSSRPSPLRNTHNRKEKAFLRDGRGRLDIVRGGGDLDRAIQAYEQVYAASWKVPEPHPEFIPGLLRLAAARDWLRLGLAWYDGKPVAAQIWLVVNRRASIYKLAYDERYAALSAGTLLTAHLMKHVLDADKVAEVDYLIGDEPYKQDWMAHRRERWGIVAYNARTLRGRLGSVRQTLGEWRRRRLADQAPPG